MDTKNGETGAPDSDPDFPAGIRLPAFGVMCKSPISVHMAPERLQ